MKIKVLFHTFCTHPPAIQQWKPYTGAKKIYSTKLKMFLFHSKNWRTKLAAFGISKNTCVIFHMWYFRVLSDTWPKYLGMQWWHAIFNEHFSIPVNFVPFVYLGVFLWLNCVSMNICHLFWLLHRLFCDTF